MKKITVFLLVFFVSAHSFAVKRHVPAAYSTIQSALNACNFGDTVYVQPGVYAEHIVWPSTDYIKLISAGDSSNTIIDATYNGRCISINPPANTIDSLIIIKGFKLMNGYSDTISFNGVAIYVSASAKIKLLEMAICKNEIKSLNPPLYSNLSGGICYFGAYSALQNSAVYSNSITSNNATVNGAMIRSGDIDYNNNVFIKNEIIVSDASAGPKNGWLISAYPYGGLYNYFSKTKVISNIVNFTSTFSVTVVVGSLIYISTSSPVYTQLSNLLVANNSFSFSSNVNVQGLLFYNYMYGASSTEINQCTFADNIVAGGATVINSSAFLYGYFPTSSTTCWPCVRSLKISNSILWNPTLGGQEIGFGNSSGTGGGTTTLSVINSDVNSYTAGINCISQNPQFVSLTDHHLLNSSPCLNAGTTTTISIDLDGNPRPNPVGSFPDMGCYESGYSTGISEILSNANLFFVYPNPNNGEYLLHINELKNDISAILYDMTGQILQTKKIQSADTKFDMNERPAGIYFLKLLGTDSGTETVKIIRQ